MPAHIQLGFAVTPVEGEGRLLDVVSPASGAGGVAAALTLTVHPKMKTLALVGTSSIDDSLLVAAIRFDLLSGREKRQPLDSGADASRRNSRCAGTADEGHAGDDTATGRQPSWILT
ncbi:MAG: hypothetical protein HKN07_12525 [Acidimicrobiia bacterium]|nr:hypothetical protein [Acidimicrobiia bacterium]